ncbi:MAG: 1,4-dihydroxy-2-naphthoate octaprenyltransferase [Cytophagales bacterium]
MASIKHWIGAARLRTLPLSFASILAGSAIIAGRIEFKYEVFFLTLTTTLFLQILSNFANDYGDSIHGADHKGRKGPKRMVSGGQISVSSMKQAIVIFSLLSFISGVLLLYLSFPKNELLKAVSMLVLGLLSIWAAINYTAGRNPYGYAGWGDFFVLVFFGIVGVMGTAFLQIRELILSDVLPAISFGLFSVAVLNVNNMRDIESDKHAGKFSIPVRIGYRSAKIYHSFLIIVPQVILVSYANHNNYAGYEWSFMIVFPILWLHLVKVWKTDDKHKLDSQLKVVALSSFLMGALMFISRL